MVQECINTIRFNVQRCPPNDYSCRCNLSRGFNSCLGTGSHCSTESSGLNLLRMTESESQSYCTANSQINRQNVGTASIDGGNNPTPVYPILANIPLATDPSNVSSLPANIVHRNSVTRLPFYNAGISLNLSINWITFNLSLIIIGGILIDFI